MTLPRPTGPIAEPAIAVDGSDVVFMPSPYLAVCSEVEACALIDHEFYHAAQAVDDFGAPRFNRMTGEPIWRITGHDVEEHIGIVRRYGAYSAALRQLVAAANRGPAIAAVDIAHACGTCLRKAA